MINKFINWCRCYSLTVLRWSMGILYVWFGILKLLPHTGEAEDIGYRTLYWLSGNNISQPTALLMLGGLELIIGIGLLSRKLMPLVLLLLFIQLAGTLLPLFIFKNEVWDGILKPTLAGHYILKNLVLIASGIVLTATANKTDETIKERPGI